MIKDNFGLIDNRFLAKSLGVLDPKTPITAPQETSLTEVIGFLQKNKIGCIILTDLKGKLSGIFTERDVLLKVALKDLDLRKTPVSKIMTFSPHTATMTTSVAFALSMMSQGGYRHIPIVDDDNFPMGIISVKDIVDYIAKSAINDLVGFK